MKCLTVAVAFAAVFADAALAKNFLTGLLSSASATVHSSSQARTLQLLQEDAAAEFCGEDGEPPCPETGCSEDFEENEQGLCVFSGTNAGRAMLQTVITINGETIDGEGSGSAQVTVNGGSTTVPLVNPAPTGTYGEPAPIVDPTPTPTPPPATTPPTASPTESGGACVETGLPDFSFCAGLFFTGTKACINDCVRVSSFLALCLPSGQRFQSSFADNTVITCS